MKNIFISMLNFNGNNNTIVCVDSLRKINGADIKLTVLIIDNGSAQRLNLENKLLENMRIKVINNVKNLGFAGGHNVGIKYALENGAEYVVILNNDTYVDKNFLKELLGVAEKDNKIGILVPKIYFAPGFEFHKNRYKKEDLGKIFWCAGGIMDWENVIGHHRGVDEADNGQYDKVEEAELATGCCMLIKREVFEKVGIFDDKYFLYYEDSDLNIRARNEGFKTIYVPKSIIWHKNAGSAGGSGSNLQDYYITRNRLIFGFRHAPIRSKLALFRESLFLLFRGREWQKRGVLDFYLGKLGKGSYEI